MDNFKKPKIHFLKIKDVLAENESSLSGLSNDNALKKENSNMNHLKQKKENLR